MTNSNKPIEHVFYFSDAIEIEWFWEIEQIAITEHEPYEVLGFQETDRLDDFKGYKRCDAFSHEETIMYNNLRLVCKKHAASYSDELYAYPMENGELQSRIRIDDVEQVEVPKWFVWEYERNREWASKLRTYSADMIGYYRSISELKTYEKSMNE